MNIILKYLQFLHKIHNYTQDDLAKKLDISWQAVSKWETVTAFMVTSPETNSFCERMFPDIDFEMTKNSLVPDSLFFTFISY